MRIVVLDDDEPIAQFMAAAASDRGWEAQTVTDEREFQALIRAAPPDAIILDLQLGASDGVEQLRFLHSVGYGGAIVLTSGFDSRVLASAEQIGASLGLWIVAVIEKPTRSARIHAVLATIQQGAGVASARIGTQAAVRRVSAKDVATAIGNGYMDLYLQPIVCARGYAVTGAEALIRWLDPVMGPVAPDEFIPAAEQDPAVIDRLTMWVAETAVAHYRRLARRGAAVQVSINVSRQSLRSPDFPDRMAALMDRLSAPPGAIGLEITESVAMHDLDAMAAVLTRLRLKGFPVAIDDFGTGHSSLTSLRRMPFSTIKIDKSFVGELETSNDSLTIVRSVIQLARDMGLTSVAEGVATAHAAEVLSELGIDCLQGYYFSGALPFEGFATWLDEWSHDHPVHTQLATGGRA